MRSTKNYRLSSDTVKILEAIKMAKRFFTYDELFNALIDEYLARKPTLRGTVEKAVRASSASNGM